ncbi:MAG TPA: agmatinase [Alphaproteobacteria bacterium]|nr:agmatinase [Alphaproteobacteria bacterium]
MGNDANYNQPIAGNVMPRFAGPCTFMRLPEVLDASKLDIALIGVPWDGGTTNRAGARHGPREIRNYSSLMRRIHPVSRIAPYELCQVADVGDVPINPIDVMDSLGRIERFYDDIVAAGATPLSAGGDHLMTLPILRALGRQRPVGMVHFDAHCDTADSYFGGYKYTHGTPFRRAVEEGVLDPRRTIQIGIRGSLYERDDWQFSYDAGMRVVAIEEYFKLGYEKVIEEARRVAGEGPTYVSFDVDGLDPVFAPGTGTPEIGGYSTFEAQQMVRGLKGLDLVGGDVVEVSPPYDPSGLTAIVGATMMFEMLCLLADCRASQRHLGR